MADQDRAVSTEALQRRVQELGRTIASAKAEIAALRVGDISASHIPSATDELDAIVAHTASATDAILETCETLDSVAASLTGEPAAQLVTELAPGGEPPVPVVVTGTWTRGAMLPADAAARWDPAVAAFPPGGQVVLFGGAPVRTGDDWRNDTWMLGPNGV